MLGLGLIISSQSAESSAVNRGVSLTAWSSISVGAATTPSFTLTGAVRATVITLVIDDSSDYNGTVSDYSLTNATVTNQTNGQSASNQTFTFSNDVGAVVGGRFLSTGNNNFQSLVGAASGHTIVVTGNLTLSGYESPELTATRNY
jgi:hypothetical protein